MTGDQSISFYVAGSFMALSGIICFPLRRIARWEAKREQAKKGKGLYENMHMSMSVSFPDVEKTL
jgi:hypothetical protein